MRIVISACLLGLKTRYDGRAKPVELPAEFADAEIIPFCPEVAAGLGVPREPMTLADGGRVVRICDRTDMTECLEKACAEFLAWLEAEDKPVDLFVLKSRSPSCGIAAPVRDANGAETGKAAGIWAAIVRKRFPDTPIKDETQI